MKSIVAANFPFVIKVCGITNRADGQAALDAGANALGFNFYRQSPRYCPPVEARAIVSELQGRYLRVGVFVNATAVELREIAELVPLDIVQLHGALPQHLPEAVAIWRAVRANALPAPEVRFDAYLIDTPTLAFGGSGATFDWKLAAGYPGRSILAGGLDSGNIQQAIAAAKPAGVDACSRLEWAPGRKDHERVTAFVRAASEGSRQLLSAKMVVSP